MLLATLASSLSPNPNHVFSYLAKQIYQNLFFLIIQSFQAHFTDFREDFIDIFSCIDTLFCELEAHKPLIYRVNLFSTKPAFSRLF